MIECVVDVRYVLRGGVSVYCRLYICVVGCCSCVLYLCRVGVLHLSAVVFSSGCVYFF